MAKLLSGTRIYGNAFVDAFINVGGNVNANGTISTNALVINGVEVFSSEQGANITVTRITANIWNGLYTANVIESASNLYYTNARVLSALTGNITIGNLVTGTSVSNSYVTAGNVNAGNVIATTLVLGSATGGSVTGANLLSANNIQGINWIGLYSANVIENTNLYFTNARVFANVIALLPTLAGSGIQIQANGQISANISGTSITSTSNVSEGSNLYYTNARVLSALTGNVTIGNLVTGTSVSNSYVTAGNVNASNVNASNVIATTLVLGSATGGSVTGANLLSANNIQGINWLGVYTANVIETAGNLYFTNARVVSALSTDATIVIEANGQIRSNTSAGAVSLAGLTTANLAEGGANLYFSNARVLSAVIPYLTTSNVAEGSNLYYTNARVRSALSSGTGVSYNQDTGQISIGQDIGTSNNVTFANLTVSGDLVVQGNTVTLNATTVNIEDKNLLLANGAINAAAADGAGITIDGANATITYVNATDSWNLNKDIIVTSNVTANIFTGNLVGNATGTAGTLSNFTTANLAEGGANLYFSNARVFANVAQMSINVFADVDITGIQTGYSLTWNGNAFVPTAVESAVANVAYTANIANTVLSLSNFTTANVAEGSNLYYTNTRVRTAFTAGKGISILSDGTIKSTASGGDYNISLTGATAYTVSNIMAGVSFTGSANDRYIIRSIQVTNISDSNLAYVSANVIYSNGNTAYLGNLITVPLGGFVEFISRTQVLQSGDSLYLQGFDNNFTPTSNILSAYLTYESISNDLSYVGTGQTLSNANANILIATADFTDFIIESIKFVNLKPTNIPIQLYVANATTAVPKAYFAYNTQVPAGSSLEILQSPKVLKTNEALYARYANSSNADSIAVFTSYRKAEQTSASFTTLSVSAANTAVITFITTVEENTVLYYTIE